MYKMRMIFQKCGAARFISHLDLMHTFQRSFARAGIPIWQTEGFNKHAYVSVALPLSVGFGGNGEVIDFNLDCDEIPTDLTEKMNHALPHGIRIVETYEKQRPVKDIAYGKYIITLYDSENADKLAERLRAELTPEISLVKRSKSGESVVKLAEFMPESDKTLIITANADSVKIELILAAGQNSLSPNTIITYIKENIQPDVKYNIVRDMLLDCDCKRFS